MPPPPIPTPTSQWNVEELSQLDKFLSVSDEYTKGGGLLGIGLCCSKVRNDIDPAFAVLGEYLDVAVGQPKVRGAGGNARGR